MSFRQRRLERGRTAEAVQSLAQPPQLLERVCSCVVRLGESRFEHERAVIAFKGVLLPAEAGGRIRPVEMRLGQIGFEECRMPIAEKRVFGPVELHQNIAPDEMGFGIVRLKFDCPLAAPKRLIEPPKRTKCACPVGPRRRKARSPPGFGVAKPQRFFEARVPGGGACRDRIYGVVHAVKWYQWRTVAKRSRSHVIICVRSREARKLY